MALTWPDGSGPNLIVDDGGDATLLIHRGYAAENNAAILDEPTEVHELQCINDVLKKTLKEDPQFWHKVAAKSGKAFPKKPPLASTGFIRCRPGASFLPGPSM